MDGRSNNNQINKPQSRPQRSTTGLPNPNEPVRRPQMKQQGEGNTQKQTQQPRQYTPPTPQVKEVTSPQEQPVGESRPKKKKGKFIALGIAVFLVVGAFGIRAYNKSKPAPVVKPEMVENLPYDSTGRYALDTYLGYLKEYDATEIFKVAPNSWVGKEWKYSNSLELRQNWIKSVCAYLNFEYPTYNALDTNGNEFIDENGSTVQLQSDMLKNESIKVTVVDYATMAVTMREDKEQILSAYKASGYSPEDYTYNEEMVELMLDYLLSKSNYPTKVVELTIPIESATSKTETVEADNTDNTMSYIGAYQIADDSELDKLLFSSDEFHDLCDTYSDLIAEYEYSVSKTAYNEAVAKQNEEKKADADALTARLEAEEITQLEYDLLNAETRFTEEELNKKIEEEDLDISDTVKTELMQPKKEYPEIPPLKSKADMFGTESVVHYTWCGAYFCKNEYEGDLNTEPQVGDGTFELPAGVGTSIVTKALCSDGLWHDIKVTLMNYCTGEDAIVYAQKYSEKNRGWDKDSLTQLICYEVQIENLEGIEISLDSQMFLSDKNSNKSTRTGSIFGFTESITLKPYETGYINDWATSTELPYKYLCWGSEFSREYPIVWFRVLAGSGEEIEEYDATASYVGIQNSVVKDEE